MIEYTKSITLEAGLDNFVVFYVPPYSYFAAYKWCYTFDFDVWRPSIDWLKIKYDLDYDDTMDSSFLVNIQATRPALRLVFARASWKVVTDSTVDEGEMQLGSTVAHVNTCH